MCLDSYRVRMCHIHPILLALLIAFNQFKRLLIWRIWLWTLQRGQGLPYDLWLDISHHETSWPVWLIECLIALSIYVTALILSTHQNREYKQHQWFLCRKLFFFITSNLLCPQGHLPWTAGSRTASSRSQVCSVFSRDWPCISRRFRRGCAEAGNSKFDSSLLNS